MNFNINNIHTIFESVKDEKQDSIKHGDETGANIDNTLASSDLIKLYDNICPITGDVFASMKDAAADPKNLKLTMVKTEDLGEAAVYVEAMEFATFCEAADLNIGEAAEEIENMCNDVTPGIQKSELHVVFPSDALNKDQLGSMKYGTDVQNDWAMQLMTGCRRYGIAVNSGVEDSEPVTESAKKNEFLSEGSSTSFKYRGLKVYVDGDTKKIKTAFTLCDKYWDMILDNAAKNMFNKVKSVDFHNTPEKFRTIEAIRDNIKLESVGYDNEGNKYNPICGSVSLSFDTDPSLDPHHSFTLYVDFDKDNNPKFGSVYDG